MTHVHPDGVNRNRMTLAKHQTTPQVPMASDDRSRVAQTPIRKSISFCNTSSDPTPRHGTYDAVCGSNSHLKCIRITDHAGVGETV
jgi:hypothetical protein